jgi:hypothetical protein
VLNSTFNSIGDLLFLPLSGLNPVLIILVLSVLIAAGSLVVFRWTSNQAAIREAKGRMKAHLVGVLLFRHDLRQVFRSIGLSLLASLANLRFMVVPLLVMIVPLVLLFVQFEMRLGLRALRVGEQTILRVHAKEGTSLDSITIDTPVGVVRETPGVRVKNPILRLNEVDFRLRAVKDGAYEIRVKAGDVETVKLLHVSRGIAMLGPVRVGPGFLDSVLYPTEPPLPAQSPLASIELAYPEMSYALLGIDWAWWVLFLVFMILALFVLKGPLGVDF